MKRISLVVIVGVVAALIPVSSGVVFADHEASNLSIMMISDDRFYNWDFESDGDDAIAADNVDWPVTMVFYNNADINLVKRMFYGQAIIARGMHARLMDAGQWTWDSDHGTKQIQCPIGVTSNHMRLYADSDDQMYNTSWGYYVLGTTHQDRNECGRGTKWSGNSEAAEEHFASFATEWWGSATCGVVVFEDWSNFANAEDYEYVSTGDRDHLKDNNGQATSVYLPDSFNPGELIGPCGIVDWPF